MTSTDTEVKEDVADTKEICKVHPGLMVGIISTMLAVMQDNHRANELELLYFTVKKFIKSQLASSATTDAIIATIFTYYIEAHRTFEILKLNKEDMPYVPTDLENLKMYNAAALSIFDLYTQLPNESTVRRMLMMATESLREVVTLQQSNNEERQVTEIIADLSSVALFSHSIKDYIKPLKRRKNYPYILWLKSFFEKLLSQPNLEFMKEDLILKAALTQVTNRKSVVVIPQLS